MTTHAYPRARYLAGVAGQDALLVAAFAVVALTAPSSPLGRALLIAIPFVLAYGALTLHFPSRVEKTDESITFHRYGRAHSFLWKDVERIRVRRFLVRDRVMIRVVPAPPWRGRYWVTDAIEGWDALVPSLERISRGSSPGD